MVERVSRPILNRQAQELQPPGASRYPAGSQEFSPVGRSRAAGRGRSGYGAYPRAGSGSPFGSRHDFATQRGAHRGRGRGAGRGRGSANPYAPLADSGFEGDEFDFDALDGPL